MAWGKPNPNEKVIPRDATPRGVQKAPPVVRPARVYDNAIMRERVQGVTRATVKRELPCFGHFHPANCAREGFIGKCPISHACRKDTEKVTEPFLKSEYDLSARTRERLRGEKAVSKFTRY